MSGPEATVLYDQDCGFCKWSLDKILAWDRSHKLRPVPIQSEEGQRLLAPISEEKRLDSFHLVMASGEVKSAGAAAPLLLDLLPGGGPLAGATRALPGATERAYRAVANNRNRLARLLRIDSSCSVRR
jgi:predicted DCC family thiol-disulfide oxidoreductase YuxK